MICKFARLYALSTHTKTTAMPMASILRAVRGVTCSDNKPNNSVVENKRKVNIKFLRSITQRDWLACRARQVSNFTDPAKVNRDQDWPTHTDRLIPCLPSHALYTRSQTLISKLDLRTWPAKYKQILLQTDPKTPNPQMHCELTSENTSTCSESQA